MSEKDDWSEKADAETIDLMLFTPLQKEHYMKLREVWDAMPEDVRWEVAMAAAYSIADWGIQLGKLTLKPDQSRQERLVDAAQSLLDRLFLDAGRRFLNSKATSVRDEVMTQAVARLIRNALVKDGLEGRDHKVAVLFDDAGNLLQCLDNGEEIPEPKHLVAVTKSLMRLQDLGRIKLPDGILMTHSGSAKGLTTEELDFLFEAIKPSADKKLDS